MNTSEFNPLALDNQLCFGLYVCSKEIIRLYAPILEPLGLTYTSYITLLSLWEKDNVTVKELGARLFLDSGTLTPLLKKMEGQGFLTRTRSTKDERTVYVKLTPAGKNLRKKCLDVPKQMMCNNLMSLEEGGKLLQSLHGLMSRMACRNKESVK
ncbi:MAG: MarR family transcriptional regulator [Spirochaetaceae bacterium]|nr:MarR family transcriptional regulator [Spirochaetaceae bacterium]MBP5329594.1 MarR family transcriptional regulator [Spirochaetaceae bacterium]